MPAGDSGQYQISGSVWDAGLNGSRPQDWELLVNGVEEASGYLSGLISRSEAETFDIFANLTTGGTVDLELYEDTSSPYGNFVGTNMSIDEVTPEPGTAILWLTGIGLMIVTRKRIAHLFRNGSLASH